MNIKRYLWLAIFISLTTTIGCHERTTPTLRLGTNIWPGYEPLYLARTKSFFSSKEINLVEYSNTSQVLQAYRNELIDAAAITLDELLLLIESGETPIIVLVMDISHGGDVIIGQSDIENLSNLKGKKIGVEANALGAFMLTRSLEFANLNVDNLAVINLPVDQHEYAFLNNEIDAVVTFEPVRSKLISAGGKVLFDSSQMPGEIVDVLVVRREYLLKHPGQIRALKSAWFKALEFIEQYPAESATILGQRMKLNGKETIKAYEGLILPDANQNNEMLSISHNPKFLLTAKKLSALMHENGLTRRAISLDEITRSIAGINNLAAEK